MIVYIVLIIVIIGEAVAALLMNRTWKSEMDSMNNSWSELCAKQNNMNNSWSELCAKQNNDWKTLAESANREWAETCAALRNEVKEEREKRWGEISRAAGLENELIRARRRCDEQTEKLSAILCPRSDHVWEERDDGKRYCRKCGKEA